MYLHSSEAKTGSNFSEDEWVKAISSSNALINGHLKAIAEKIGVEKIRMHVARHWFADIANRKTGDMDKVSDALDHSSVSVTENYLRAATRSENDNFVGFGVWRINLYWPFLFTSIVRFIPSKIVTRPKKA